MCNEQKKHREEDLQRLRTLRLIDDRFMSYCFEDYIEGAELLLKIILDRDDLKVSEVRSQKSIMGFQSHDVRLDIYASDKCGNKYNVEIQRANEGANPKRARYHSAVIDTDMLKHGEKYRKLCENYVIFITENDVFKMNEPIYHIERIIQEGNVQFDDGEHIIYVNGAMRSNDTALGRLMNDFYCTDADDMCYKELSDRVRYFKNSKEGVDFMCQAWEEIRKETEERISIEHALKMIKDGSLPFEKIAEFSGLPIEKIMELAGNKSA